jgi:hypothetical protein
VYENEGKRYIDPESDEEYMYAFSDISSSREYLKCDLIQKIEKYKRCCILEYNARFSKFFSEKYDTNNCSKLEEKYT